MATPAAGVTISWGGVSFQQVTDLRFTHGGSLPISRGGSGTPFSVDLGSIEVVCLHTANCTMANYGKRATFQVAGSGFVFTHKAIYERLNVQKTVNDAERYTVTLRFAPV